MDVMSTLSSDDLSTIVGWFLVSYGVGFLSGLLHRFALDLINRL